MKDLRDLNGSPFRGGGYRAVDTLAPERRARCQRPARHPPPALPPTTPPAPALPSTTSTAPGLAAPLAAPLTAPLAAPRALAPRASCGVGTRGVGGGVLGEGGARGGRAGGGGGGGGSVGGGGSTCSWGAVGALRGRGGVRGVVSEVLEGRNLRIEI